MAILFLYAVAAIALGLALAPALLVFRELRGVGPGWPALVRLAWLGTSLGLSFFVFGFALLLAVPATVMGNVAVGAGAVVLPHSVLLPGSCVGAGETWGRRARPADRERRARALQAPGPGDRGGRGGVTEGAPGRSAGSRSRRPETRYPPRTQERIPAEKEGG